MAVKIIRGADRAPIDALTAKSVAVVGFGNQGHAHALNLRDSGVEVVVANRPDTPNGRRAIASGFSPQGIPEAVAGADLVILSVPDEAQPQIYGDAVAPHLRPGATVGFLHGFNIRYGLIEPARDLGVIMVAPKGPGATLRRLYVEGRGLPCLFAMHQDSPAGDAEAIGLAWANGIGAARAGIIYTTFADETETDLFGEQAVLCGGMTELIRAAFEILRDAGYPPELAYLECCHEVKQVADLVYERGPAAMFEAISNTAEFGSYRAGPFLIDESVRQRMRQTLAAVRDGTFAAALRADYEQGFSWFERQRQRWRDHGLEPAGQIVRSLMPWLADTGDDLFMNLVEAVILGLVEGITEYLPISSTGHLILARNALGLDKAATDAFLIVIQGGAILAVLGLYRQRVAQMIAGVLGRNAAGRRLAMNLLVAFLPAAVLGPLLHDRIEEHLFHNNAVVGALAVGGLVMIGLGPWQRRFYHGDEHAEPADMHSYTDIEHLTWRRALLIGLMQCLAMWPGTSRSMVTIVGGMLVGMRPRQAAEFSFLLGLPTLGGAVVYSAVNSFAGDGGNLITNLGWLPLAAGFVVATISAGLAIKWLVGYLNRHGLAVFGWYRLVLAVLFVFFG